MTINESTQELIDPNHFRETLGHFPTGVVVVTAVVDGEPLGMVVGSFTSVSLDPPLVAYLPSRSSSSYAKLGASPSFCINVLSVEQEALCRQFASRTGDKYAGVAWHPSALGSPILDEAVAWIECSVDSVVEAGDHDIVIGLVTDLGVGTGGAPLLFFQGGYGGFSSRSLVAGYSADLREQLQIADVARRPMESLADELGLACYAQAVVDGDLVIVAGAGAGGEAVRTHIGRRMPFRPPYGALLCDDDDLDDAVGRWERHAGAPATETVRQEHLRMLREVRKRDWSIGLVAPSHDEVWAEVAQFTAVPPTPELERRVGRLMDDLMPYYEPESLPDAELTVRLLGAPVRRDGHVVMVLTLYGMPPASRADLDQWVERLRATADDVSEALTVV